MPLVVDKDAIRLEVIEALDRLSETRPLTDISLREVAAEAGMSHTKVLRYFESKNNLLVSCVHWASSFVLEDVESWFRENSPARFESTGDFLGAFFRHFQQRKQRGTDPRNVVLTCAMGAYSDELKTAIKEEFAKMDELLGRSLAFALGAELTAEEIRTVSVIYFGVYFQRFNEALPSGSLCDPVAGMLRLLSR